MKQMTIVRLPTIPSALRRLLDAAAAVVVDVSDASMVPKSLTGGNMTVLLSIISDYVYKTKLVVIVDRSVWKSYDRIWFEVVVVASNVRFFDMHSLVTRSKSHIDDFVRSIERCTIRATTKTAYRAGRLLTKTL